MKREHKVFTEDYIKHHDKLKAYAKAYPGTNPANHHSSAAKLLRRADVKARIKAAEEPADERALAELQEIAKERIKLEKLEIEQKRHTCALIVMGKWKIKRSIKLDGELVDVYNDPSPTAVLRAIELDTKLENGWYLRDKTSKKDSRGIDDAPWPNGAEIFLDGITKEPKAILRAKWTAENPGKMRIISEGTDEESGATVSLMEHTEDPPWTLDPDWYSKQPGFNSEISVSCVMTGNISTDSVSKTVQIPEQPLENLTNTKAPTISPPALSQLKTDTTDTMSNKKKSYWEMNAEERWAVYLPLNTNVRHYTPEQLSVLERAYYNMSVKAQVNRIVSLEESEKFYQGITRKR